MADLLEPRGQDMLEETSEELDRIQGHLSRPVCPHAAVAEGDLAIVAEDDSMVADGDAEGPEACAGGESWPCLGPFAKGEETASAGNLRT